MAFSVIPVAVLTGFWGVVGIILPFLIPKGTNKGIIQAMLILTAVTCWLLWLCCYMAQMNPLIGPVLNNQTLALLAREWGKPVTAV